MPKTIKVKIEQFEFDCRVSGDKQNELVIFLHGFPETSFMWRKVMDKLASLGFYCIAPNMRGYSAEACPKGVKNYHIKYLRKDILNLAKWANKDRFHLVGHDWGAAIGWNLVFNYPKKIISWTALSVPHTRAFTKAFKTNKEQKKKSRYILWFLLPLLPEFIIRRNNFEKFRRLWKLSSSEEVEKYLSVFSRKQSLTAALNYYRANIGKGKGESIGDIHTPTLFIWGKNDMAIASCAAESNHKYMKGDYTFLAIDAGHWLIQERYSEIEAALIYHLKKYKTSTV